MSKHIVANRYADALFQLGKEKNSLEQFEQDLRLVKDVFNQQKQLLDFLKHPKVESRNKKDMLKEAFASLSAEVMNTLLLLVDRHREEFIPDMIDSFFEKANEARGIAEAKVYSVRALNEDEKKALSDVFAKEVGKATLQIENIVDKTLIGGVKLRIGNRIYDGSVSGKLQRIERQLISANE